VAAAPPLRAVEVTAAPPLQRSIATATADLFAVQLLKKPLFLFDPYRRRDKTVMIANTLANLLQTSYPQPVSPQAIKRGAFEDFCQAAAGRRRRPFGQMIQVEEIGLQDFQIGRFFGSLFEFANDKNSNMVAIG
jgi:hypothetical protein